jgi:hypothetical protein
MQPYAPGHDPNPCPHDRVELDRCTDDWGGGVIVARCLACGRELAPTEVDGYVATRPVGQPGDATGSAP